MSKRKFTEKEKSVMLGLCSYPRIPDRLLSKNIDVKSSTISTIRNSLVKNGLLVPVRIPNYYGFGAMELVVSAGHLKSNFLQGDMSPDLGVLSYPSIPFFLLTSGKSWFTIGAVPRNTMQVKWAPIVKGFEEHVNNCSFNIHRLHFPADQTYVARYFDFRQLLENEFQVASQKTHPWISDSSQLKEYSKPEKDVLFRLIKYPEVSDYRLSDELAISHPTLTKMRKRFIADELFHETYIPEVRRFGFSTMAWISMDISGSTFPPKLLEKFNNIPQMIFSLSNKEHFFALFLFKTLKELSKVENIVYEMTKEPIIHLMYIGDSDTSFQLDFPGPVFHLLYTQAIEDNIKPSNSWFDDAWRVNADFRERMQSLFPDDFDKDGPPPSSHIVLSAIGKSFGSSNGSIPPHETLFLQHAGFSKLYESVFLQDDAVFEKLAVFHIPHLLLKKSVLLLGKGDLHNLQIWQNFLKKSPFIIIGTVTEGKDAVKIYKEMSEFDMNLPYILMDLSLENRTDGVETVREILKMRPETKVVVVTSFNDPDLKKELLECGVKEYLVKPVTGDMLISVLESATSVEKRD